MVRRQEQWFCEDRFVPEQIHDVHQVEIRSQVGLDWVAGFVVDPPYE